MNTSQSKRGSLIRSQIAWIGLGSGHGFRGSTFHLGRLCVLAVLICAGPSSSRAQEPTCQYTISLASGVNFIANHCDHPGGNTLDNVFPSVPAGSQIQKWNLIAQSFGPFSTFDGATWSPSMTLDPGEGAVFLNPGPNFPLTISGLPHAPVLPLSMPYMLGYLISSQQPVVATVETITGLPPLDGDRVLFFDPANQTFGRSYLYMVGIGWVDEGSFDPVPQVDAHVGESFFYFRNNGIPPPQCDPVQLTLSPSNLTVRVNCCTDVNHCATFTAAAIGTPPLSYQWLRNGEILLGANDSSYMLCPVSAADDGNQYSVRISNECGSVVSEPVTLTVFVEDVPPTISCPPDITVQSLLEVPQPDPGSVTGMDQCGKSTLDVVHVGDELSGMCPMTIARTYEATDSCGLSSRCVQTITVEDNTPPMLEGCQDLEVMAEPGDTGAQVTFQIAAFDPFSGPVAVTCDPEPGFFAIGQTEVECVAVDACGNRSVCRFVVTVHGQTGPGISGCCAFTQGYYGNPNGKFNGTRSIDLVGQLLAQGPLTIGAEGIRSLTIQPDEALALQARMPSGGKPATLPTDGDWTLDTILGVFGSKGRFNNVLMGQTLTLSLNLRLSECLPRVRLAPGFCTFGIQSGPDGLRGTSDDVTVPGDLQSFSVPNSVRAALVDPSLGILDNSVGGLLELANRALAGLPTGGASASEVNDAVDAINRGFDECRVLVDCASGEVVPDSSNDGFENRPTLGQDIDPVDSKDGNSGTASLGESQPLGQCNLRTRRTNLRASKEPGEPNHGGNAGGKSVWWRWRSPITGPVTIQSEGSSFDTLLAVYTGNNLDELVLVATSDDSGDALTAEVTFDAEEGVHYQIAVDGFDGESGSIVLTILLNRPDLCMPVTVSDGQVELCIEGSLGCLYTIEGSSDLETWTPVATVQNTGGRLRFTDPEARTEDQRFYRVIEDP